MSMYHFSDNERREVARRLRELRSGWSSGECYYIIIHALELPDTSREDGGAALYARLADLIEPSIPADPGEAGLASLEGFIREHTEKPVDRDALLELADEMFEDAIGLAFISQLEKNEELQDLQSTMAKALMDYARRIREALGVK